MNLAGLCAFGSLRNQYPTYTAESQLCGARQVWGKQITNSGDNQGGWLSASVVSSYLEGTQIPGTSSKFAYFL